MLVLALIACAPHVPVVPAPAAATVLPASVGEGPVTHTAVVSARWAVPLKGLVDTHDPAAADLDPRAKHPIVLPVHVLEHPTAGVFVVDSGVAREVPARGLVRKYLKSVEVEEPLADILAGRPLAGVLLTHTHLDHVVGLADVPDAVVYAGPGDERGHGLMGALAFPTFRRGLGDRPLHTWTFADGELAAVDVVGDGSILAISVPGHTEGSTAYLARTTEGPVLFTGDCSHTRWGWDHGVAPGTFTEDHEANARSLAALKAWASTVPGLRVEVGHELTPTPPARR
ncbi:MAG: MBL fold metallo-hydrolase [Alphaproteobacteria bacterium]|nr:MBL fold metallo-hydrolase [Alphaproteobacteria bacterium]MCB9690753.1 MBL fold metallo-hydrolase [Alphaproteobacteria bacterium]